MVSNCEFVTFPLVTCVRCGTSLYRFLIFASLLTSFVDILFFSVSCLRCLCAHLFICALWSLAGKVLTYWVSVVVSNCEFVTFPLYPGLVVVLDCIDS